MKVCLDLCALKRPFDDQSPGRIFIETAAVARSLEAAGAGRILLCSSAALEFENRRNPNESRRNGAAVLLEWIGPAVPASPAVFRRARELLVQRVADMDALHVSFAEDLRADVFVTVDDQLLALSERLALARLSHRACGA